MINLLIRKTYHFYRRECCWPYSLSFLFVLVVYAVDFFPSPEPSRWPSVVSYLIIAGYYVYNVWLFKKKLLFSADDQFFIGILTVKIIVWGMILGGLLIFKH